MATLGFPLVGNSHFASSNRYLWADENGECELGVESNRDNFCFASSLIPPSGVHPSRSECDGRPKPKRWRPPKLPEMEKVQKRDAGARIPDQHTDRLSLV